MNQERYKDSTADIAVNSVSRNRPKLSAKAIYARFKELPVSSQYNVIKYKALGNGNSIMLTTDNNMRLCFTITRKGWMLEAM